MLFLWQNSITQCQCNDVKLHNGTVNIVYISVEIEYLIVHAHFPLFLCLVYLFLLFNAHSQYFVFQWWSYLLQWIRPAFLLQRRSDLSFVRVYVCEREHGKMKGIFSPFSLRHYGMWPDRSVSSLMHTHTIPY